MLAWRAAIVDSMNIALWRSNGVVGELVRRKTQNSIQGNLFIESRTQSP